MTQAGILKVFTAQEAARQAILHSSFGRDDAIAVLQRCGTENKALQQSVTRKAHRSLHSLSARSLSGLFVAAKGQSAALALFRDNWNGIWAAGYSGYVLKTRGCSESATGPTKSAQKIAPPRNLAQLMLV